jgi:hypothetical protein
VYVNRPVQRRATVVIVRDSPPSVKHYFTPSIPDLCNAEGSRIIVNHNVSAAHIAEGKSTTMDVIVTRIEHIIQTEDLISLDRATPLAPRLARTLGLPSSLGFRFLQETERFLLASELENCHEFAE